MLKPTSRKRRKKNDKKGILVTSIKGVVVDFVVLTLDF